MSVVEGWDATGKNLSQLPAGLRGQQGAGYSTGSGAVPWTAAQRAQYPGAVRIDQSPGGTDPTADVYDVEANAGTLARLPGWIQAAQGHYHAGTRPGQRWPMVYTSAANVTNVANTLKGAGINSGVPLWVAHWGIGLAAARLFITTASGPYPIKGVQYVNQLLYDLDVWESSWLTTVSQAKVTPVMAIQVTTLPPGWWEPPGIFICKGSDGNLYEVTLKGDGTSWGKPVRLTLVRRCELLPHGKRGNLDSGPSTGINWTKARPPGRISWKGQAKWQRTRQR